MEYSSMPPSHNMHSKQNARKAMKQRKCFISSSHSQSEAFQWQNQSRKSLNKWQLKKLKQIKLANQDNKITTSRRKLYIELKNFPLHSVYFLIICWSIANFNIDARSYFVCVFLSFTIHWCRLVVLFSRFLVIIIWLCICFCNCELSSTCIVPQNVDLVLFTL